MHFFRVCFILTAVFVSIVGFGKDLSPRAPKLLPPWILFQNEMRASIGRSSCVKVDLLEGSEHEKTLKVRVTCDNKLQGIALSSLLTEDYDFSHVLVHVRVFNSSGEEIEKKPFPSGRDQVEEAKDWVSAAHNGSELFTRILPGGKVMSPQFYVVYKGLVQFKNDDLGEGFRNGNRVAAESHEHMLGFDRISPLWIGIGTEPEMKD